MDKEAIRDVTAAAFGREQEARIVDAIRASDAFVPELSLVAGSSAA
jgi:putative acetyltransferase